MSSQLSTIDSLLAPHLFQVIGSTPESLRDSCLASSLADNPAAAAQVAATSILAASTVKKTVEGFASGRDVAQGRAVISNSFSIEGKVNMSSLTLIGHCLMTTEYVDGLTYASAFRKKLGQKHLWDGDLTKGRVSEKQLKILQERKKGIELGTALLFGNGFFKITGLTSDPFTAEEAAFWNQPVSRTRPGATQEGTSSAESGSTGELSPRSLMKSRHRPGSSATEGTSQQAVGREFTLPDFRRISVPADVLEYMTRALHWNNAKIESELMTKGEAGLNTTIRALIVRDPEMRGAGAASTVGKK